MSDKPTYEDLEAICRSLIDENMALRKELAARGDVSSIDFRGIKVIVSPTTPAFVWDGKEISVLKVG